MSGHQNALPYNVAVVNKSATVRDQDLARMCGAIQKQVLQDVAPAWHVAASVLFSPSDEVPLGYWPVYVQDGLDAPGAAGYHDDDHRQPRAYVDAQAGDVSVTLSHEILEMIADPFGSRLWVHHCPDGRVIRTLIEICDPPEETSYIIDGVRVSDFALPHYYRSRKRGVQRTHMNVDLWDVEGIGLGLAPGGYVSWVESSGHWAQATWFTGRAPAVRTLGKLDTGDGARAPRSLIDQLTREFKEATA